MAATAGFRTFVAGYEGPLLRTAYLLTGDRGRAEELLAAALTDAHRRWRRGAAADPVGAVRRAMVRSLLQPRPRHRPAAAVRADTDPSPAGSDTAPLPEAVEALRRALADLPPRTRAAVVLRLHEDLTAVETAGVLGCSPGEVTALTDEATAALRARHPAGRAAPPPPTGPSPDLPPSLGPAARPPSDDDAIYRRPR